MYWKSLLISLIFLPTLALAADAEIAQPRSFLSTFYCSTIGKWVKDVSCEVVPVTNEASLPSSPTPSAPQSTYIPAPTESKVTTIIQQLQPTVIERIIQQVAQPASSVIPVLGTEYVTRDFLSRQIDSVFRSVGKSISDIDTSSGGSSLSDLSSFDTGDLTEGSNLYFTDARVASYISGSSTVPHVGGSAYGDLLYWTGSVWNTIATSSLGITGGGYGDTNVNSYIHASTTMPKLYTANTFSALQTFNNASTTQLSVSSAAFLPGGIWNASGNVGIGTTSPYAKLSVVGEIVGSYFTATSSTATSTFAGAVRISGDCIGCQGTTSDSISTFNIAGWGDSLTAGPTPTTNWLFQLQRDYLPNSRAYNGGVSGENSTQVSARQQQTTATGTDMRSWTNVIYMGTNGVDYPGLTSYHNIINSLTSDNYVVLSINIGGGDAFGTTSVAGTSVVGDNPSSAFLQAAFPNRYFDQWNYVKSTACARGSSSGWTGIWASDQLACAANTMPPSATQGAGNVHYTTYGQALLAEGLYAWLRDNLWTDERARAVSTIDLKSIFAHMPGVDKLSVGGLPLFSGINLAGYGPYSGTKAQDNVVTIFSSSTDNLYTTKYMGALRIAGVNGNCPSVDCGSTVNTDYSGLFLGQENKTAGSYGTGFIQQYTAQLPATISINPNGGSINLNGIFNNSLDPTTPVTIKGNSGSNTFLRINANQNGGYTGLLLRGYSDANGSGNTYVKAGIIFNNTETCSNYCRGDMHFLLDPNASNANVQDNLIADTVMMMKYSNMSVGIGTTSPYAKLSVVGQVVGAYFTGTTTTASTFAGSIGIGTTSPTSKLSITQSSDAVAGGIFLAATGGQSRALYMDSSNILSFTGNGNTATLNAAGAWTNASDRSYKENIIDLGTKYGLATVLATQPRSYTMKNSNIAQVGFVAQELKPIIPEVVEGEEGTMGISYGNLVAVAFQAIKELNAKVVTLTTIVTEGISSFKTIVVESLTIGSSSKPSGITLYDEDTGAPYCLKIKAGQTINSVGACIGAATSTTPIVLLGSNDQQLPGDTGTTTTQATTTSGTASTTPPTTGEGTTPPVTVEPTQDQATSTPPAVTDGVVTPNEPVSPAPEEDVPPQSSDTPVETPVEPSPTTVETP